VALAFLTMQGAAAQVARKPKEAKGPRALGLVEISSDGKARLIPISIMVDGKFYDAGAYKASPVPFALWTQTVYEGQKTGVSQGLFTVAGAVKTGNNNWFAEGKWTAAGSTPKAKPKESKPKFDEEDEGPPKLRRSDPAKPDTTASSAPPAPPAEEKQPAPAASAGTPDKPATAPPAVGTVQDTDSDTNANDDDPNRPILKRGKAETLSAEHPKPGASTGVARRPSDPAKGEIKTTTQRLPAISDAAGPDLRPYLYDIKPDEEQKYRKGMLSVASEAVMARFKELQPATPADKPAARAKPGRQTKQPQPTFADVQFRAFDLWNTNEPVFVLSATAHVAKPGSDEPERPYYITLVAKNNIYDELRKLYVSVTDPQHLDQSPRLELIDAVDADGDGRGELLFRRISDTGKAWGVYRAGADQLFPLFEGTPGP
jgi:hypothetical protein